MYHVTMVEKRRARGVVRVRLRSDFLPSKAEAEELLDRLLRLMGEEFEGRVFFQPVELDAR